MSDEVRKTELLQKLVRHADALDSLRAAANNDIHEARALLANRRDDEDAGAVRFAEVAWTVADVLQVRPNLSYEQAEQWLNKNEKYIRDRVTELGWDVIKDLLAFGGIKKG